MAGKGISGWLGETTWTGMSRAENLGMGAAIGGNLASIASSIYAVKAMEYQAAMAASRLEFEKGQAFRRARLAELSARDITRAGEERAGQVGLEYGQRIETERARTGASGVEAGVGSRKEFMASAEMAKDITLDTVRRQAADQAAAARMQSGSARAQGTLLGGQAAGVRSAASAFEQRGQTLAGISSLLTGTGNVMNTFMQTQSRYSQQRNQTP